MVGNWDVEGLGPEFTWNRENGKGWDDGNYWREMWWLYKKPLRGRMLLWR